MPTKIRMTSGTTYHVRETGETLQTKLDLGVAGGGFIAFDSLNRCGDRESLRLNAREIEAVFPSG